MQTELAILFLVLGYLIGSISVSRLVARIAAPNVDLTKVKMIDQGKNEDYYLSNVGATTASVALGPKVGGIIAVLDILKGLIPTLVVRLVYPGQPYVLFLGGAIVGGHIWSVYHRFKGGGGISPSLGVFLAIDPLGTLAANVIAMFLGMVVFREYLLAMTLGTWLMIPWLWISQGHWGYGLFAFLINLMLILAMIPDVSRYVRARKMGVVDTANAMESIPMGSMMNKMMAKMGLAKKDKVEPGSTGDSLE